MFKSLFEFIVLISFFVPALVVAEIVQMRNHDGSIISAEYLAGDNGAKPILILHGFLQTNKFPTVSRLATALNESGYSVLTPTLSLGINKRNKSLACEAIHTHNMKSDTQEISLWVNWLNSQTGKPVNLIGHSAGSLTLINFLHLPAKAPVDKTILISLSYFGEGLFSNETMEDAQRAYIDTKNGFNPLGTYAISFCKVYPTRALDFLSYYEFNRDKVAKLVSKYAENVSVIIGTDDLRADKNWRMYLKENDINVISIDGANHFFDQSHEFELFDKVESLLEMSR